MGIIKQEIKDDHLKKFPDEFQLIQAFLPAFDITWAKRRRAYNTEVSVYFLKPLLDTSQLFGFDHEIMLIISKYKTLEARSMQAADTLIGEDPARGRVDQSLFFIITEDPDGQEWVKDYSNRNPQARIPIGFSAKEILINISDVWHVKNLIRNQLFSRDLFDYQLPIDNDLFFFGRETIVAEYIDAIKRSQNRGLFGLRKTGKTSILYKIKRSFERDSLGCFLYYDCKLPSIRQLHWHELLSKIINDLATFYSIKIPNLINLDKRTIPDIFISILAKTPENKRTAIIFDEIEYISPLAIDDLHWHSEFVPFWQSLWSAQSQVRRMSSMIVGVNPTVAETDTFSGIQNPMFGIIQPKYLGVLPKSELKMMLTFFGSRMGINFTESGIDYLASRYGGHPLLTRMACSKFNDHLNDIGTTRPVDATIELLSDKEEERDRDLSFYCRHVVSELKRFYPSEYEILELMASHQTLDAMELSQEEDFVRHLKEYGILQYDSVRRPQFAIPVVGKYIETELKRQTPGQSIKPTVALADRSKYVKNRTIQILKETRELLKLMKDKRIRHVPFEDIAEAERFSELKPVSTQDEFVGFINICNRCFVENVESHGRKHRIGKYFWTDFKSTCPDLWIGLNRIKSYRHNDLHLELNEFADEHYRNYLKDDLSGKRITQVTDVWFVLQQAILDNLLLGVQCEFNRFG